MSSSSQARKRRQTVFSSGTSEEAKAMPKKRLRRLGRPKPKIGATKSQTLKKDYCLESEGLSPDEDCVATWGWKGDVSSGKRKKFVSSSCSIEDQENDKSVAVSSSSGGSEREEEEEELGLGGKGKSMKKKNDDVRAWLRRMELERYADLFEEHEVDYGVLPFLSTSDLIDMGIRAVGARSKIICSLDVLRDSLFSHALTCTKNGDVRAWLRRMELERYADLFEEHEVDYGVLPFLSTYDLIDMGIRAVGARRKIIGSLEVLKDSLYSHALTCTRS